MSLYYTRVNSGPKHKVQLGAYEMLKHSADVISAPGIGLNLMCLFEQVFDVGTKGLAGIEIELRPLRGEMRTHLFDPPLKGFVQL